MIKILKLTARAHFKLKEIIEDKDGEFLTHTSKSPKNIGELSFYVKKYFKESSKYDQLLLTYMINTDLIKLNSEKHPTDWSFENLLKGDYVLGDNGWSLYGKSLFELYSTEALLLATILSGIVGFINCFYKLRC